MDKIERQKLEDRDIFSYDEKKHISAKSDGKCAHCGKTVFMGFQGTIDHFIPISKGGNNRDINLIMLCKDCNKEKNNKILGPHEYLPYLHEEDLKKLEGYLNSYILSFEYISRNNILACDEYSIYLDPPVKFHNNKSCQKYEKMTIRYSLKKATDDDIDKLSEYLIKYFNKRGINDNKETVKDKVCFWLKFGCVYYIEGYEGIKTMISVTAKNRCILSADFISKVINNEAKLTQNNININIFPSCSNMVGLRLIDSVIRYISGEILSEQDLDCLPTIISFVKNEKLSEKFFELHRLHSSNNGDYVSAHILYSNDHNFKLDNISEDSLNKLNKFFNKIEDIGDKVDKWVKKHPDSEKMKDEIYCI